MIQYDAHQLANLFHLMKGDEFAALVASIRQHGFDPAHPIVLYEGKILDGRNRYRAAQEAGVEATFVEWTGGDPWAFVWRENAVRRHLDPGQRAALFIKVIAGSTAYRAERSEAERRANEARAEATRAQPREGNRLAPSGAVSRGTAPERPKRDERERNAIAAEAKVSSTTAGRALSLKKKSQELFDKVAGGEVSLTKALEQANGGKKDTAPAQRIARFDPTKHAALCRHCRREHSLWRHIPEPTYDGNVMHKWICERCSTITTDVVMKFVVVEGRVESLRRASELVGVPIADLLIAERVKELGGSDTMASVQHGKMTLEEADCVVRAMPRAPTLTRDQVAMKIAVVFQANDLANTKDNIGRVALFLEEAPTELFEAVAAGKVSLDEAERSIRRGDDEKANDNDDEPDEVPADLRDDKPNLSAAERTLPLFRQDEEQSVEVPVRPLTDPEADALAPLFALVRQIHPDDVPDAVAALQAIVRTRGAA